MGKQAMLEHAALHGNLILTSSSNEEEVGTGIEIQLEVLKSSSCPSAMTNIQENHNIVRFGC